MLNPSRRRPYTFHVSRLRRDCNLRMYRDAFEKRGLHPKNLSRTVEDSGTLSSPLVPWNTCGAFMASTLMVPTAAYFPYAFLNLLTPVIAVTIAFAGFRIAKLPEIQAKIAAE